MDPVVSMSLHAALAFVFGSACFHKARDLPSFRDQLAAYQVLPLRLVRVAAMGLAAFEGLVALLLIASVFWRSEPALGPAGAAVLLALYTIAMAVNLARGRRDLDCGCAGPRRSQPIGLLLVVRNGILLLIAGFATLPAGERTLLAVDWLSIAFAIASFALLYEAASLLTATAASPLPSNARRSS